VTTRISSAGVETDDRAIVERGERGIWRQPLTPQKLYLNTKAYEVTVISTKQQIIRYGIGGETDDSEIEVRTSDGFTFPVDVRVEYQIRPEDAPLGPSRRPPSPRRCGRSACRSSRCASARSPGTAR
jgi:hypothetical protein